MPIPLESILIPYFQTHRERLWRTASVVTLACLAGAAVFYLIGAAFMQAYGSDVIHYFSDQASFDALKASIQDHGFVFILAIGISPVPFQIGMLSAGAVEYSFSMFLAAAAIARGIRYFGLAWLVLKFGDQALEIWNKNKLKAGVGAVLLLLAIYLAGRGLESLVLD
ncbi:YqaA family protein [Coraliomargarita sp. W4R72]